ncbi:MAG TPA: tetratricopeptide repeat protein, partial [Candidatus Methylacidiphilales bacterium]
RRGGAGRYLGVLGLFALGLMAKPMLVTFPATLLLLDFWPLRRLTLDWPTLRARLVEKIPFFVLSLVAAWVAFHAVAAYGEVRADVPLGDRLANACLSYAGYLRKTVWPDDLIAFYLFPAAFPAWKVGGAALLLGAVTFLALRRRAREERPWLAFGWLWFLGTLVPVIGLVKSGYYAMADRYTYVPLVGLFTIAAWELGAFAAAGAAWKHFASVCAAILLLPLCAVLALVQQGQWQNSVTLFTRMLEVGPNHSLAHFNLATGLLEQGDLDGAVDHFRQCLALRPNYADARNLLAQTLLRLKPPRVDAALREALIACRIAPNSFDAHHTLGAAYEAAGRKEEAAAQFRLATELAPQYPNPHRNLGLVLIELGRVAEGRAEIEAAARLGDPESARLLALPALANPAPSALPPTPGSPNSNRSRR